MHPLMDIEPIGLNSEQRGVDKVVLGYPERLTLFRILSAVFLMKFRLRSA